jgi:hypothetical protein
VLTEYEAIRAAVMLHCELQGNLFSEMKIKPRTNARDACMFHLALPGSVRMMRIDDFEEGVMLSTGAMRAAKLVRVTSLASLMAAAKEIDAEMTRGIRGRAAARKGGAG